MTQKTNQFNMTTKRYSEEDILSFMESEKYYVLTLSLSDKYGEYGTTGLAIVKHESEWLIDTFLLSCRILGRKAENALMSEVVSLVRANKGEEIFGSFIETEKNFVAQDAYQKLGFVENDHSVLNWKFSLENDLPFTDCIKNVEG